MKKYIFLFAGLLFLPVGALALTNPVVTNAPLTIDADIFVLKISVEKGAKVSVIGGTSDIPPITDGAGSDQLDGMVEIAVGLVQNQENVFSIKAEKDGAFSETVILTMVEKGLGGEGGPRGDVDPPNAPKVDAIKNPVKSLSYKITGSTESGAKIYVKKTDGSSAGSTLANANGLFSVEVKLEPGKTNRFNIYAQDAAYNKGKSTQVVIQALLPEEGGEKNNKGGNSEGSADSNASTGSTDTSGSTSSPKSGSKSKGGFSDIEGHWSEIFVNLLASKGIITGKADGSFGPNDEVTRAELLKMALKTFYPLEDYSASNLDTSAFSDVSSSDWHAPYVMKGYKMKLVEGYKGEFLPNKPITRAAALKILLEASGLNLSSPNVSFSDVPAAAWFSKYVSFAKNKGIVKGYSDGTFRPQNTISRAEVAKIIVSITLIAELD